MREKHVVNEFVGCEIKIIENTYFLHQTKTITKLINEFDDDIQNTKSGKTPMSSHTKVVRHDPESIPLNEDEQTRYQSGVGSLLYLLKHSRPYLSNSVREL